MAVGKFLGIGIVSEPSSPVARDVLSPKRGEDGLFIQPHDISAKRETVEQKNRTRFAAHFNFADDTAGLPNSVDSEQANYNCGRCNQEKDGVCLLLGEDENEPFVIDKDAGSCEDWEFKCAGDPEMTLYEKSPDVANYGVAKNGKGFGCHRCPYASKAFAADSLGRELYCGKGDFRTFGYACCSLNGAPTIEEDESDDSYDDEDDDE